MECRLTRVPFSPIRTNKLQRRTLPEKPCPVRCIMFSWATLLHCGCVTSSKTVVEAHDTKPIAKRPQCNTNHSWVRVVERSMNAFTAEFALTRRIRNKLERTQCFRFFASIKLSPQSFFSYSLAARTKQHCRHRLRMQNATMHPQHLRPHPTNQRVSPSPTAPL